MTMRDEETWLRPSPGLWRMRRAELVTVTVVLAAFFGLVFLAAWARSAGGISLAVVIVLGAGPRGSCAAATGPGATRNATRT